MGQFSWFTQDTNEQIYNDWDIHPEDKQTIHMVDPRDGTDYKEEEYEGYGVFGGRDFHELLADINKDIVKKYCPDYKQRIENYDEVMSKPYDKLTKDELDKKRLLGIDLWFAYIESDTLPHQVNPLPDGIKIVSPILVKDYSNWTRYMWYAPESDPDQGWHVEKEEYEDDV